MTDPVSLQGPSPRWLNDANSKQVGLFVSTTGTTAAVWSDSYGGSSYSVPAGKVLKILHINHLIRNPSTGVRTAELYGASTPTGTDHIKATFASSGTGSSWDSGFQSFPVYITIEAGDYVTIVPNTTDGYYGTLLGVETTV